jgi:hypothetical protein
MGLTTGMTIIVVDEAVFRAGQNAAVTVVQRIALDDCKVKAGHLSLPVSKIKRDPLRAVR